MRNVSVAGTVVSKKRCSPRSSVVNDLFTVMLAAYTGGNCDYAWEADIKGNRSAKL